MSTVAAAVGRALADAGVRHAFGVVGGGNIMAVAGLTEGGVRYVAARHEGGAMAMADAYFRACGEVAVCTTSHGAGVTNVATGLAEAARHGSGVLLLCGDAPTGHLRRNDIDQRALVDGLGGYVVRVDDPATAPARARAALRLARRTRSPVALCLPADLSPMEASQAPAAPDEDIALSTQPSAAPDELAALADALTSAHRPVLLAGLGAWHAGAAKPVMELADRTGAVLATTVMAAGLFAEHPWSVGTCGGFAAPAAARILGQADLVVAFGASLDPFTLHHGRLLDPDATVIRVDVAAPGPGAVGRVVVGDAAATAAALLERIPDGHPPVPWRDTLGGEIDRARAGWLGESYEDAGTAEQIDPRTLTRALLPLLPAERTLVLDGGHFIGWPLMNWPVGDPSALVFMGAAFQAIGLGFAGAVGAAAARPDRTTVVVLGDGGALMGLPELETLVRTGESALVVVHDDAAYGFEVHLYGPRGADRSTASFTETDFAGVARAFGATAVTVRSVTDLDAVRAWRDRGRPGTLVVDCKVARGVVGQFLADLIAAH
ncbi:thiamine pyrophosphate-binding protein [Micromonospora sp. NPDC051543]|uniref:thiamine pyrophosphate-binding protein n=1 Tax=Micromonospora sp. NPDC051543 TaxID=3364287 RepID=UPI0037A75410